MSNNVAVNAVSAYMQHYSKKNIKIKTIRLCPRYWEMFSDHVKRNHESFQFQDAIELRDVIIRKGSQFQIQNVEIEFA